MALPPFDPGVKLMVAWPSPAVAESEVGAEGVVDGVTETAEDAELSPYELIAFR